MIKFKKNFKKFNFNTKPNAWTIRFNEIYEYFLCVTPKTVSFSCGCKYHIFIDFHLMYCWHILANKHHDMPDTNYDKFNLVVSTLFLNKWYLKKSTFFENDPYDTACLSTCNDFSCGMVSLLRPHPPLPLKKGVSNVCFDNLLCKLDSSANFRHPPCWSTHVRNAELITKHAYCLCYTYKSCRCTLSNANTKSVLL